MGRPYKNEIRSLADTYQWAASHDSERLRQLLRDQLGKTLIAIGSGGSYSTAASAVALHRHYHRSPGYAVTPLELEALTLDDCACSLWLFSGSGRNIDIRRALKRSSSNEGNQLTVFCGKVDSPLEKDARKAFVNRVFSFDTKLGKDGYLATNSLFASTVLLAAAFASLPYSLSALVELAFDSCFAEDELQGSLIAAAGGRSNAIILYGPSGKAGALDLESKFTEGAIIASSTADYRNFAHGRHNWINRFGADSVVVAFVGPGEDNLARQTLVLLPSNVPHVIVPLGNDFATAQALSVYFSIRIAGWLGDLQGIDPGRPRIPEFGRKLYHLRARLSSDNKRLSARQVVIGRKALALGVDNTACDSSKQWARYYAAFRNRLRNAPICAVIFDYDGTLVTSDGRFDPPTTPIIKRIVRLLETGVPVGIATGRGDSARQNLQSLIPRALHERVLIGYNNASQIAPLDDNREIDGDFLDSALTLFHKRFLKAPILASMPIRNYPLQISILASGIREITLLWGEIQNLADTVADGQLKVMVSSHSLDVIPKSVSKEALVSAISETYAVEKSSVLRIGDCGCWPGNDYEMLRSPLGLSVRDVSADSESCWNLLPARCSGVDGTLYYLDRLLVTDGVAQIRI